MMQFPFLSSNSLRSSFPPFDLGRLLKTVFDPRANEKVCILIDLADPSEVIHFEFLRYKEDSIPKKAYEVFYTELKKGLMHELGLSACDFFAYEMTNGNNLELPPTAIAPNGIEYDFSQDIYSQYDIILCLSTYSATAPLTLAAKRYGFRGATLHGLNETILQTGLAVDYFQVSRDTEKLRLSMTQADNFEIDFVMNSIACRLFIELGGQEAQKSHGLCLIGSEIVNLPAGEVYFVPLDAFGSFPIQFPDGTLAILQVEEGRVVKANFVRGEQSVVDRFQAVLDFDPAVGIISEVGFGTQNLPFSGADIQDEKIFGTFHLAMGRNDHLDGPVTLDRFIDIKNAIHEDLLYSPLKTPEIKVRQVRMQRHGRIEVLIENNLPSQYLQNALNVLEFAEMI